MTAGALTVLLAVGGCTSAEPEVVPPSPTSTAQTTPAPPPSGTASTLAPPSTTPPPATPTDGGPTDGGPTSATSAPTPAPSSASPTPAAAPEPASDDVFYRESLGGWLWRGKGGRENALGWRDHFCAELRSDPTRRTARALVKEFNTSLADSYAEGWNANQRFTTAEWFLDTTVSYGCPEVYPKLYGSVGPTDTNRRVPAVQIAAERCGVTDKLTSPGELVLVQDRDGDTRLAFANTREQLWCVMQAIEHNYQGQWWDDYVKVDGAKKPARKVMDLGAGNKATVSSDGKGITRTTIISPTPQGGLSGEVVTWAPPPAFGEAASAASTRAALFPRALAGTAPEDEAQAVWLSHYLCRSMATSYDLPERVKGLVGEVAWNWLDRYESEKYSRAEGEKLIRQALRAGCPEVYDAYTSGSALPRLTDSTPTRVAGLAMACGVPARALDETGNLLVLSTGDYPYRVLDCVMKTGEPESGFLERVAVVRKSEAGAVTARSAHDYDETLTFTATRHPKDGLVLTVEDTATAVG